MCIYPANKLNPMFFLGLADLSDGWAWVGGVFATSEVGRMEQVKCALPDEMSNLRPSGSYRYTLPGPMWTTQQETPSGRSSSSTE